MENNINFTAIIVAAGSGSRMGFDKMRHELFGKSVIARTVEISLEIGGADFKFGSSYTSGTSNYNICKVTE